MRAPGALRFEHISYANESQPNKTEHLLVAAQGFTGRVSKPGGSDAADSSTVFKLRETSPPPNSAQPTPLADWSSEYAAFERCKFEEFPVLGCTTTCGSFVRGVCPPGFRRCGLSFPIISILPATPHRARCPWEEARLPLWPKRPWVAKATRASPLWLHRATAEE